MHQVTAFTENEEIYPFHLFVVVVIFVDLSYKPGTTTTKKQSKKTEEEEEKVEAGHVGWRFVLSVRLDPEEPPCAAPQARPAARP